MEDHGVAAIGIDQAIFGAPAQPRDAGTGQALAKIRGEGAAQVRSAQVERLDTPSFENRDQPANGRFDFGQLRHRGTVSGV
jgi:hypothetical protein